MDTTIPDTESLPVKLNDQELRDRAKLLGEKITAKAELEEAKKASASEFKLKIENVDLEIYTLGHVVTKGEEHRPVPVTKRANHERGLVEFVRLDTGEVYSSRAMSHDERQAGLFDEDAEHSKKRRSRKRDEAEASAEA
jgi:hypothetical protein